jgi:hypothetical protein
LAAEERQAARSPPPIHPTSDLWLDRDVHEEDSLFGLYGGYRRSLNRKYNGLVEGGLTLEVVRNRHATVSLILGGGVIDLKNGTRTHAQVHDPFLFELGAGYRYSFTPPHAFLQPYLTISLTGVSLLWDYRGDVISGGHVVQYDDLFGVNGSVGAGLIVRVTDQFRLFGEVAWGRTGFGSTTTSGVSNTLFSDFGYVGIKAGLKLAF